MISDDQGRLWAHASGMPGDTGVSGCDATPSGDLSFSNLMAEAALTATRQRGIRCPTDIALVGFDDFRSATALTPPLSVVEQNPVEMGATAVEVLAQVIETGRPSQILSVIPTRLVIRASCGCANLSD